MWTFLQDLVEYLSYVHKHPRDNEVLHCCTLGYAHQRYTIECHWGWGKLKKRIWRVFVSHASALVQWSVRKCLALKEVLMIIRGTTAVRKAKEGNPQVYSRLRELAVTRCKPPSLTHNKEEAARRRREVHGKLHVCMLCYIYHPPNSTVPAHSIPIIISSINRVSI